MTTVTVEPKRVNILGMELDKWQFKSCQAHVGTGSDWATIYLIKSKQEGQGHATKLLLIMKSYYESQGKRFGGSVALSKRMKELYSKCGIREMRNEDRII